MTHSPLHSGKVLQNVTPIQEGWDLAEDSRCVRSSVRVQSQRHPEPTAAIIDSQSVKTTKKRGERRQYDAGKKIHGRKRHLLVDSLGLILGVVVHPANIQDRDRALPGWGAVGFRAGAWGIAATEEYLGRREICGGFGGVGAVVVGLGVGDCPSVGRGLRLRGSAASVDCGVDVRLVEPVSSPEQRLRIPARDERSDDLRGHDPSDAQTPPPLQGLLR